MGLFSRRQPPDVPSPEDWAADPQAALRRSTEGTGTYVDEHGRRRKLTPEMRAEMEAKLSPPKK